MADNTKRETVHNPKDDHGTEVDPFRDIPDNAGWLHCPKNPVPYTGENAPWRR